jgi:16S rRNA (guanine527-N7)-methyltransferase
VSEAYGRSEFQRDTGVSHETIARLETHLRLLADWSARMNLVGPHEIEAYWRRHAFDCAQLLRIAPEALCWLDLGSGAGLPGIIVASLLADTPGASVHLVESTRKKCDFLRAAVAEAGLPAKVFNLRIEAFGEGEGRYDAVTARALAPLPRLIAYAKPFLDRGALGLFHKGADFDAELAAAKQALEGGASGVSYRADLVESLSDPRGRIIRIRKAA